jgi:transposase
VGSQSVRIAEESGSNQGYDAAERVLGRKRNLLADTSGLLLAERVPPVNICDNRRARELLAGLVPLMPRLELIWVDSAYAGEKLRSWCAEHTGWQLAVVPRNSDSSTFELILRRPKWSEVLPGSAATGVSPRTPSGRCKPASAGSR